MYTIRAVTRVEKNDPKNNDTDGAQNFFGFGSTLVADIF